MISFGTDGVRGPYGEGLVTEAAFFRLAQALHEVFSSSHIVVASDTRLTSAPLKQALIDGGIQSGILVYDLGVCPTPILAKSLDWLPVDVGVMVTASHNLAADNGFKVFLKDSQVLSDGQKKQLILCLTNEQKNHRKGLGKRIDASEKIQSTYLQAVQKSFGKELLKGVSCLVDAAHGAWHVHTGLLSELGASVTLHQEQLKPAHINHGCGTLHVDHLVSRKSFTSYDMTLVFDGDGDRGMLLNAKGDVLDGDDIIYHLAKKQKLPVVGTVMSNMGLELSLSALGLPFYRTHVGDEHVYRMLVQRKGMIGGEPCGHVMNLKWMGSSDPLYHFLTLIHQDCLMTPLPERFYQKSINIPIDSCISIEMIQRMVQEYSSVRSVIRHSGTEPVIRVMLEGPKDTVDALNDLIAQERLGVQSV